MCIFNEQMVKDLFENNLLSAKQRIREIEVFCGSDPDFKGLSGWVFEKTVQYCIRKELKNNAVILPINEQVSLGGRSKVDLVVGKFALEIKSKGIYSQDQIVRYQNYRTAAEQMGYQYVFIALSEAYMPYRQGIINAIGEVRTFYLFSIDIPEEGEWERFINLLCCV